MSCGARTRPASHSTWLRQAFPEAPRLDLLDAPLYVASSRNPHRLEAIIGSRTATSWAVLDEIQKAAALLTLINTAPVAPVGHDGVPESEFHEPAVAIALGPREIQVRSRSRSEGSRDSSERR